jgi:hypothetical protein
MNTALDAHSLHVLQSHEPGIIKLGPISMGDRLRIGADFTSDEESEEGSPTPPPQKRHYKHKAPSLLEAEGQHSSPVRMLRF